MKLSDALPGLLLLFSIPSLADEPLRLETQFGESVSLLGDGQARIIVYADQEGSEQTAAWGDALESIPCPAVAAANLSAVPDFARPMVRESFREEEPVALDWEGRLAGRLDFKAGQANVYLVDGEGRAELSVAGAADAPALARIRKAAREACGKPGQRPPAST